MSLKNKSYLIYYNLFLITCTLISASEILFIASRNSIFEWTGAGQSSPLTNGVVAE